MWVQTAAGILIPFLGTGLGAACVFLVRGRAGLRPEKALSGFAAGIMVSASFFSLIRPALEQCAGMGGMAVIPVTAGFLAGMLFLLFLDILVSHIRPISGSGGMESGSKRAAKLALAVTLHNLPEGMAVGIAYAGCLWGDGSMTAAGALALSVGIALQNIPEGAIISMPLRAEGVPRGKSFLLGMLSGAVEPIGAALTVFAAGALLPVMPCLLCFAAGAMFYVVVDELIPSMEADGRLRAGTLSFAAGFAVMMAMDVGLG